MKVNDIIAESMLNPATPDLQEFVFVFYIEANAILWNYLAKEHCSKICLIKLTDNNKELFNSMFAYKRENFCTPFKMKIKTLAGNDNFLYEFNDVLGEFTPNFPSGNSLNDFIDLFVKALEYPSKIW